MIKLLIVLICLFSNLQMTEQREINDLNQQIIFSQKKAEKKKPVVEWKPPSEYSNNPTFNSVVEVAKKNYSSTCKIKLKFSKVLNALVCNTKNLLSNQLQVEFADKSTKILQVYEDMDGSFEFDSCKDQL